MAWPLIIFLLVTGLISYLSPNRKHLFRVYVINVLILLLYSLVAWSYILTNLDAGGASLGPGLVMLALTFLHIIVLIIYMVWTYKVRLPISLKPIQTSDAIKNSTSAVDSAHLQAIFLSVLSPLTYKIVAYTMVPNFDTDECVDWAIEMVERGYETENLLIIAGLLKPTNYFETIHYLKLAIAELNLEFKTGDDAIISFSSYYIKQIAQGINIRGNLKMLCNYVYGVDYPHSIYDFYRLNWAWEELDDRGMQSYWEGATPENIGKFILNIAKQWLIDNEQCFKQPIE